MPNETRVINAKVLSVSHFCVRVYNSSVTEAHLAKRAGPSDITGRQLQGSAHLSLSLSSENAFP